MAGGRILGMSETYGYRPVLIVANLRHQPQYGATPPTTVLYGEQVLLPFMGATGITSNTDTLWKTFLGDHAGKSWGWGQLRAETRQVYQQSIQWYPRLPVRLVAKADLTLLACGHDPMTGHWVQFSGHIPLFNQQRWWEPDDSGYSDLEDNDCDSWLGARE